MNNTYFMQRAIELSCMAVEENHGGPFGCVIVKDGAIIAEAHNEVLSSNDPTAHAETLAIRRASAALKNFDLSECELFTNGAPCCMCMSAMLWARIGKAYYALSLEESTAIGLGDANFYEELARPLHQRQIIPMVYEPSFSREARKVYQLWHNKPGRKDF